VKLLLSHRAIANRSCSDCQTYWYDDGGEIGGPVTTRGGKPLPRPPQSPTPCKRCPKIAPGDPPEPSSAIELTDQHWETWTFYRECRAVGSFPDDPRVRWAAAIIRAVEDESERRRNANAQMLVLGNLFRRVNNG
jgi:hypothetical protein